MHSPSEKGPAPANHFKMKKKERKLKEDAFSSTKRDRVGPKSNVRFSLISWGPYHLKTFPISLAYLNLNRMTQFQEKSVPTGAPRSRHAHSVILVVVQYFEDSIGRKKRDQYQYSSIVQPTISMTEMLKSELRTKVKSLMERYVKDYKSEPLETGLRWVPYYSAPPVSYKYIPFDIECTFLQIALGFVFQSNLG